MKEMKYSKERKIEVLATGYCFGLLYYILNLGTHPTAYIKMPKNIDIDENEIDVHGGVTYSEDHLWINDNEKLDGKFIGWDYAQCGKELKYGDTYTSLEIHTAMGFGYGVCEDCYEFEWKRREKDGI